MSNKARKESPLVQSVLALDNHLTELERVGTKINSTDMTADIDLEFIQKLMARFAECGQGVSTEVANLSAHLQGAQTRAEGIAQGVGRQAELFAARRKEQNDRMEEFQILSERVRNLNAGIGQFRDDPAALEAQLTSLLEDLDKLRLSARNSRMRSLEKHAESLGQALQAARKKLENLLRGGL